MSENKNFIPWARLKLYNIDGTKLTNVTLEYKDSYQEDRMRFYRLSDSEFMMIQIAMTVLTQLYGPSPVCVITNDNSHTGFSGDDFIAFLDLMKTTREEGGVFYKLDEIVHLMQDEIENIKLKEESDKTKAKYWKSACDTIINKLEALRNDLDKYGY